MEHTGHDTGESSVTDRIIRMSIGLYMTGWLIDWTYWIAVGWTWSTSGNSSIHILPAWLGWFPALFWPLHALSEIWRWVL
jgi:hypothetical protein